MSNETFKNRAKIFGLNLTDNMINQFEVYFEELISYNKKVNLTSITKKEDVYVKHFLDSIVVANNLSKNAKICDVGAGAGFPSLPLKIVRPDLQLVMLDSSNKRITFLNSLINKLNLDNTSAIHSRAEDFAKTHKKHFEYVVARAVAGLNTLTELCLPFVKVGGSFIAYKGSQAKTELETSKTAIKILGGQVNKVNQFTLPETDIQRSIIK